LVNEGQKKLHLQQTELLESTSQFDKVMLAI